MKKNMIRTGVIKEEKDRFYFIEVSLDNWVEIDRMPSYEGARGFIEKHNKKDVRNSVFPIECSTKYLLQNKMEIIELQENRMKMRMNDKEKVIEEIEKSINKQQSEVGKDDNIKRFHI